MAKGLGINGVLNKESLATVKGTHKVIQIETTSVRAHEKNRRYDPDKIEALARSIEDHGLQQPIIVVPDASPNRYIVVSGHRRHAAYTLLLSEGKSAYQFIPAIVREDLSEDRIEEDLIDGNLFTEMPSPPELAQQLARKKELMQKRKAAGEHIPGKLLEIIAAELGINPEAARRMDTINRRAIPEVRQEFENGNMSLREAFKTAQRPPEEQTLMVGQKKSGECSTLFPASQVVHVPPEDRLSKNNKVVHVPPETYPVVVNNIWVDVPKELLQELWKYIGKYAGCRVGCVNITIKKHEG